MHTGALRKTAEEELVKRAREGVEEGDAEFSVLVNRLACLRLSLGYFSMVMLNNVISYKFVLLFLLTWNDSFAVLRFWRTIGPSNKNLKPPFVIFLLFHLIHLSDWIRCYSGPITILRIPIN